MKNSFINRIRCLFHWDFQLYKSSKKELDVNFILFYIPNSVSNLQYHFGLLGERQFECLFYNHPVIKLLSCKNKKIKIHYCNVINYLIGRYFNVTDK